MFLSVCVCISLWIDCSDTFTVLIAPRAAMAFDPFVKVLFQGQDWSFPSVYFTILYQFIYIYLYIVIFWFIYLLVYLIFYWIFHPFSFDLHHEHASGPFFIATVAEAHGYCSI